MEGRDGEPLYFAGIYDSDDAETENVSKEPKLRRVSVLTTQVSKELNWLHDRMPVILSEGEVELWLGDAGFEKVSVLCRPLSAGLLKWKEVSQLVNSIKNDCEDCILPKVEAEAKSKAAGIMRFFPKVDSSQAMVSTGKNLKNPKLETPEPGETSKNRMREDSCTYDEGVAQLLAMGFEASLARHALESVQGNLEASVEAILGGHLGEPLAPSAPAQKKAKRGPG